MSTLRKLRVLFRRPATTRRHVTQALLTLGETPMQVALTLNELNITGHQGDFAHCPVANYLRRHVGVNPSVHTDWVMIGNTTVELPSPVRRFIAQFDNAADPGYIELRQHNVNAPETA